MKPRAWASVALAATLTACAAASEPRHEPGLGNPAKLFADFEAWKAGRPGQGDRSGPRLFEKLLARESESREPELRARLEELVETGERLFFEETFAGNGRTCGTCHRAENNMTIDPGFIATLPADDPLFVAETEPALDSRRNGGRVFENPLLLRRYALIVANVDGFDDLSTRFVMRGVPSIAALNVSARPRRTDPRPPNERLGYGGDGAPGDGDVHAFATGAVIQHFPKTLDRIAGRDFRLPTEAELDALEAFQRSLGRSRDVSLSAVRFRDPDVARGRDEFASNAVGKCATCHFNAGANAELPFPVGTINDNFDTGVEQFLRNHREPEAAVRPVDGGFGTAPSKSGGFGDGTFNAPSLVEFADTLPAFHNHISAGPGLASTVEGAIAFYNSAEFNASPGGDRVRGIALTSEQIARIGKFLRALNALENVRSAESLLRRLGPLPANHKLTVPTLRLVSVAAADCRDAIEVLAPVSLHAEARAQLAAAAKEISALRENRTHRPASVAAALEHLAGARSDMIERAPDR